MLAATLMSTTNVAAQYRIAREQLEQMEMQGSVRFNEYSQNQLKKLFQENPLLLKAYVDTKGQAADVIIGAVDVPSVKDSVDVFLQSRQYEGNRAMFSAGASCDFMADSTTTFGGVIALSFGRSHLRWGYEGTIGLSQVMERIRGTEESPVYKLYGQYFGSIGFYYTPARWMDDLCRLDIGAMVGIQQGAAKASSSFEKEIEGVSLAGAQTDNQNVGRPMVGAFVRWEQRAYMSRHAQGVKLSVSLYNTALSFEQLFKVNGIEVLNNEDFYKSLHAQVQVTYYRSIMGGKKHQNWGDN